MGFRDKSTGHAWLDWLIRQSRTESPPEIDVRASVRYRLIEEETRASATTASYPITWEESLVRCFSLPTMKLVVGAWVVALLVALASGMLDGSGNGTTTLDPITQFLLTEQ